jgi:hypothetical protein
LPDLHHTALLQSHHAYFLRNKKRRTGHTKAMISRTHRARNEVNMMIAQVVIRKKD